MLPAVRSVPPGGAGEWGSATAWTGEKRRKSTRRKSTRPSPLGSSGDDADMMEIEEEQGRKGGGGKHPPEEHEGEDTGSVVYSVNDEFSIEDLAPYLNKVKSRKPPILSSFEHHPVLSEEEVEKLLVRFCNLRFREYCEIKEMDATKHPKQFEKFPHAVTDWDDPDHLFDWTIEYRHFELAELNDYQRILPAREEINEYCWWDDYSSTFSNYETDVDYVMYCDALSKKIKWIEEYLDLNSKELLKLEHRGFDQAMKIAADFCHLPLSLAKRGYEEYILSLKRKFKLREVDHICFELWKRVTKQKMGFIEALREIHASNMFKKHASRIEAEIQGVREDLQYHFNICKDKIPNHAVEDGEVLKNITFAIHNKLSGEKDFLDFTIKKLKIAQRLQLTPSPCFTQELKRVLDCNGEE